MKIKKKGESMRVDRYLTYALGLSRSDVRKLIKNKRITVNDKEVYKNDLYLKDGDYVKFDGEIVNYKEFIYLMMNKPKGCVCANNDNLHETVFAYVNGFEKYNLFTVGRLDIDTTGLLLITNNGSFAHFLTSPKNDYPKTYYVETDIDFEEEDVFSMAKGMLLYEEKDKPFISKPAKLEIIDKNKAYITITEGKYHQVKKLCKACGKTVMELKRVAIGNLLLDENLALGEYRELTDEEIEVLKFKFKD